MMDSMNQIRKDAPLPLFLTLTYPGCFPHDSKTWKRDLDVFWKRVTRVYPGASAEWKLEPQKRGAPHYHLLVYGIPYGRKVIEFLSVIWYEVVGSGDKRHLWAGTRLEWIRSRRGIKSYAGKRYMGKELSSDHLQRLSESVRGWAKPGRFWGVLGRVNLPVGDRVVSEVRLSAGGAEVVRAARNIYFRNAGRRVFRSARSITVYCDADSFMKMLPASNERCPGQELKWGCEYSREYIRCFGVERFLGRELTESELIELGRAEFPSAYLLSVIRGEGVLCSM